MNSTLLSSAEDIFKNIFHKGNNCKSQDIQRIQLIFVAYYKNLIRFPYFIEWHEDNLDNVEFYLKKKAYDKGEDKTELLNNSIVIVEIYDETGLEGTMSADGVNELFCIQKNNLYELMFGHNVPAKDMLLDAYLTLKKDNNIINDFISRIGHQLLAEHLKV